MLEAVATDGFFGMLPVDLVLHAPPGGAQAYLAIEAAEAPWPPLPGKEVSAGPFYIVWLTPEASGVRKAARGARAALGFASALTDGGECPAA